jgi:hypothetical protein
MKKLLSILFSLISFASFGQTVRAIQGYNPTTMQPGVIYRDTTIALPYTPGKYITGYATVGSQPDSVRAAISLTTIGSTGASTYNSATGVFNIPSYAGGGGSYTFSTGLTNAASTITSNLSTGITGGQSVIGGTAASENLTLFSTSNVIKGKILFGTSAYDEVNNRIGIGTTTPVSDIDVNKTVSGPVQFRLTNLSTSNGNVNAGFQLSNSSSSGQVLKAGSNYTAYKTFSANDFGTYNSGAGNMSFLNDFTSGNINWSAGGSSTAQMTLSSAGLLGLGITPTAILHLKAGTATAGTAPQKFTAGTILTTPESGAVEYNGTHFYASIGATRYQLDQQTPTSYSGVLPIANGGTNLSSYTTGDLLYASGTNTLSKLAIGSSTQVLTVTGGVPVWAAGGGGGGSGWSLTGNAATDSSLNFFGTTDNRRIVLKQNNVVRGYITNTGLNLNGFDVSPTIGHELPLQLTSKLASSAVGISLLQTGGSGAEYRILSTTSGNLIMGWYSPGNDQVFASITLGTYGSLSIGNCTAASLQSNGYSGAYGQSAAIDKRGLTLSLENSSANTLINSSGSASYLAAIPMAIRALSLSVNSTGSVANTSSIADFSSTTQGLLPPRMTNTQKIAIGSPVAGLTVYCTDCTATDASTGVMQTYNGSTWKNNW